jgi:hypothetical protein
LRCWECVVDGSNQCGWVGESVVKKVEARSGALKWSAIRRDFDGEFARFVEVFVDLLEADMLKKVDRKLAGILS